MIYYRCYDIVTEDGTPYNSCVVTVPSIDLNEPVNRYEHLAAISGALENLIGPVETFSYSETSME